MCKYISPAESWALSFFRKDFLMFSLKPKKTKKKKIKLEKMSFFSIKDLLKSYVGVLLVCIPMGIVLLGYDIILSAIFSILN